MDFSKQQNSCTRKCVINFQNQSDEAQYVTFDTFFAEQRGILYNSGKFHEVPNQSYDIIVAPHFRYSTSVMLSQEDEGADFQKVVPL